MKTMFMKKRGKIAKTKLVVKVKVTNALVNIVDVHVTTWSKATKKSVQRSKTNKEQNYN